MKMIRTEIGGVVAFVPDYSEPATREAIEREDADFELAEVELIESDLRVVEASKLSTAPAASGK